MLPTNERQFANAEFAKLCQCVKVVEESLIKICSFFDDDVLQTVVAIVSILCVNI